MRIIVTGAIGFIGFHLCKKLIQKDCEVFGIDNFNSYYDPKLKEERFKELEKISLNKKFRIFRVDIRNLNATEKIFSDLKPDVVVNLAAQAGVRYSIDNPSEFIQTNLVGFSNILECSRRQNIKHLVYASSSSVYGGNTKMPFSENQPVDHPVSLYAATKSLMN